MASEPENVVLVLLREIRADQAAIRADIADIKNQLDHHNDELNVVSGLAMRATGERVAWDSVQVQLRKLSARIDALEQRSK